MPKVSERYCSTLNRISNKIKSNAIERLNFERDFFSVSRILDVLRMSSLSDEFKSHMVEIVNDTMKYREENNVSRKDFIQLLMELRKTGRVKGDGDESEITEQSKDNPKEFMTIEQCAAQVALFYLAGFDTTASVKCFVVLFSSTTLFS